MAKPREMSLQEFGKKFFDSRRQSKGNRNPIRNRERKDALKEKRITLKKEIAAKKHDYLLDKCAITGRRGKFGTSIHPAKVEIEIGGVVSTFKILISLAVHDKMDYDRGNIVSVNRDEMGATIKMVQMGMDLKPYVHIFKVK